ncbi:MULTISPECIES: hypothetical protein [Rhodocyclales]|uniref:Uncharacterized protein n=2 Tax=Rhodocyclales TaxID=206389 RepID=A0ABW1AQU2_9RHOO|nr:MULTISPECIES: hypothetical protein [Rhodocyclales]AKU12438.1 hypothetical protein AzCIB_2545 [Azoarcus sp. CIB]ATE60053.1 hypothetical protein CCZ27_08905 [Thauera sp. K11]NMG42217.1 hypothetical protein [Aromatoleum toluvorans]
MRIFQTVPQRGDFAYQCLVGPQKVSGAKLADLRDHFGLKLTKHMPFGSVRDEEGHIYSFVRAVNAPGSSPNPTKFIYQSTRIDERHIRVDKERILPRAMTMFPKRWLEGDTACWSSLDGEPGEPWLITASGERFSWKEEGLLDIGGPLIGNGMQWYLPGEDWGTFYVSQLYDVSGICEGRPVKGVIALDQAWMADGGAIHFQKDLVVNNKMHVIWWSFATIYKDGTWDAGSFMVGHENLGYAIFQNHKGEIYCTTDIEGEVRHKEGSYFAETARIVVDGREEWEFLPDPKGEMMDFVGGFPITAQQEGRWRRVGDTREPDRWMAWGESDRRNGSARNVRGSEL